MIPKAIHYCWFGKGQKPELLQGCIKSWDKLKRSGYEIVEWNEDNCDLNTNSFVSKMYEMKKYAFVSDYFRLRALYECGGIYLDTDVYVYKNFDSLLECDLFLGYIYDCALGTAVIGSSKGNSIIGNFLSFYDKNINEDDCVNNGLVSEYFYENVPNFCLCGKRQSIVLPNGENLEIYPKETFEMGKVLGGGYFTLHFSDGSWGSGQKKHSAKSKILAARMPIVNIMSFRNHQKARRFMQHDGKYQRIYREEIQKGK